MPNEVDVELFRSLSLYNIYLMQLHGSGLLERLKILLSLYKSYSIPLSTTYYWGTALLHFCFVRGCCNKAKQGGAMLVLRVTRLISLEYREVFLEVKRQTSSQSAAYLVTYEIWIELANSY